MIMTLSDWKALSITQTVLLELSARVRGLRDELAQSAGNDPLMDRWKCGVIAAYEDVINIQFDEEIHDD